MKVVEIPISKIKVRFRLRNPSDEKVDGLAESIRTLNLLHPIHVDGNMYLLSGYHRLLAHQKLGRETIPSVIKDEDLDLVNWEIMRTSRNPQPSDLFTHHSRRTDADLGLL